MQDFKTAHSSLSQQKDRLLDILLKSSSIKYLLDNTQKLEVSNWYLGAGSIGETVWNFLSKHPPDFHIDDLDLVYFYDKDLSQAYEQGIQGKANKIFKEVPVRVEAINEARVHLWYQKDYGKKIPQYLNTEDAITSWPSTFTSVGVTKENGTYEVFAPYGLYDIFMMIVRPNKRQVTEEGYENKCKTWKSRFPYLTVIPW